MANQGTGSTVTIGGFSFDPSEIDFSDHSSRVGTVRSTNITLIILVGVFVFLRLCVRAIIVRKIFLDDGMFAEQDIKMFRKSANGCLCSVDFGCIRIHDCACFGLYSGYVMTENFCS